ncbi:MAG: hypothetical protein M1838_005905 [Thelocarpon superellum]|nr:MAG: hypothetical protein M1838_005905 [Thelocarpon superellum]
MADLAPSVPSSDHALDEKDAVKGDPNVPTSTTPSSIHDGAAGHSPPGETKETAEAGGALEEQKVASQDDMDYPTAWRLVPIIIALILSIFLVALDMTIVATAIPRITDDFKSLDQVGWYGSAFFLTVAAFQSTWGKAYKYFWLKSTFLLSVGIFELGSLICAVAQNSTTLIVGRAVAGMGAAGIASGVYTIIAFSARPQMRPAFTGLLGATYGTASVIGPLLGGVFTDKLTWRWCFYINLPVGGASAAIILFTFVTPSAAKPVAAPWREKILQMDPLGTITIMGAVVCYLLALQWGGVTKSWKDSSVIGTLVGFVLLMILFVVIQVLLGSRALLEGRIFKQRIIIVGCIYVVLLGGSFFILLYYLPIYFQAVDGISPSQSGIRNIPMVVAISLFSIISGGLITTFGHYVPLLFVSSVITTIGSGLIYTLDINAPSGHWIGYQILVGIGLGLGFQIPIIVAQASVDSSDISAVTAVVLCESCLLSFSHYEPILTRLRVFQTIGGAFFVSAGQAGFSNELVSSLARNAPTVDAAKVVATGATNIRGNFPADTINGILLSYLDGLHISFAIGIALAGGSLIAAFFAPWRKIDAMKAMGGG